MEIDKLAKLLEEAVEKTLPQGKVAIAFSGGLDSATIATIAKKKVTTDIIATGMENSHDIKAAQETAGELGLELNLVLLDEKKILKSYEICWKIMPGTLTDIELMVGAYECCKKAKQLEDGVILFGSGAEENFIGYQKYYNRFSEGKDLKEILKKEISTLPSRDLKRTGAVAKYCGVDARFPFMDKKLIDEISKVPVKERIGTPKMKKPLLRKIAKLLEVPKSAIERPKKAMQYGSDIHKILLRHAKAKTIEFWDARPPFVYE
ncbi:MAG: asparagine synthase C-terminal domain-containing protein [Candidatus Micrarchaeota archaeon]